MHPKKSEIQNELRANREKNAFRVSVIRCVLSNFLCYTSLTANQGTKKAPFHGASFLPAELVKIEIEKAVFFNLFFVHLFKNF